MGKREKGKVRRKGTQNSKEKVVQLLGSESQGWRHGEVVQKGSDLQLRSREIISHGRKENDLKGNSN